MKAVVCTLQSAELGITGTLSAGGGSNPVTSATCTIVGGGTLKFDTIAGNDLTPEYKLNAGAFTVITEGATLAVAGGDSFSVRAQLTGAGQETTFNVKNNASAALLQLVTLTRTS